MPAGPPPGFLLILSTLLQLFAAVMAVLLSRKRAEHRPMALFLSAVSLANLVLVGFIWFGAPTSLPATPYVGTARLVFHVRQAFFLVWSFGLMAAYTAIFTQARGKLWFFGLAYLVVLVAFVIGYPVISGNVLARAYFLVELAGVLICAGMLIQWLWKRESVSVTHATAIMLLFCEAAVIVGPWQRDIFNGWDMARVMYCLTYLVLSVIQGGSMWRLFRSS